MRSVNPRIEFSFATTIANGPFISAGPYVSRIAVFNMRFVKPLDETLLHEIGKNFNKVITIENGSVKGGFGSAVIEFFSENDYQIKVQRMGIPDKFVEHGSVAELHKICGIDPESIENKIKYML